MIISNSKYFENVISEKTKVIQSFCIKQEKEIASNDSNSTKALYFTDIINKMQNNIDILRFKRAQEYRFEQQS